MTQEGADAEQGLAAWVRLGFADEKLNPIKRYLGSGLTYTGPFPGRDEDRTGLAIGWAEFGDPFRRGSPRSDDPLDPREIIVEVTYRAPLTSWLTLQPDLQYVINPGGRPGTSDALILGLRAEFGF